MIKLVFNGYYRSGTTMMFRIMQRSNPDKKVFWEPLQQGVYYNLLKFDKGLKTGNKEYREFMYPYSELTDKKKTVLSKKHSFLVNRYFEDKNGVMDYLKEFDELASENILQTNRAHFFLDEIAQRFNCKYVHIIRNPLDEWISFTKKDESKDLKQSSKKGLNDFKKLLTGKNKFVTFHTLKTFLQFYLSKPLSRGPFNLNREFGQIKKKLGLKVSVEDDFDKFILNWYYINKNALEQAKGSAKGKVVWYENILQNPQKELDKLSKFSDVKFSRKAENIRKNDFGFAGKKVDEFWRKCKKLGIKEEIQNIIESSKNTKLLEKYYLKSPSSN